MKKLISVILLIVLTGCSINPIKKKYQELDDINYIKDNKDKIESVIVTKLTIGSNDCYRIDINKAYAAINSLKILKESNMSVTDDYMWYTFYYNDGTKTSLAFEGPYLIDNSKKYTSYTIEFKEVDLREEDLIECEK